MVNYLNLRETDVQSELLQATIAGYERVRQITRNRYDAGVIPKTDLLQAETQLASAQADQVGLQRQRAQLEHAIAVLIGRTPADFSLPPAAWSPTVPEIPLVLPATLLQRRPDIAGAERRVAAANAEIGIARAGYFPGIGLTASYGYGASRVGDLFNASASAWSLGLSLAQRVFDAGAVSAQVDSARAAQERSAAQYRQIVLTAFQDVEDQLAASRVLSQQLVYRRAASTAADQVEQQVLNRYRAGQVSYTEVVTAQATALQARRTLAQLQADRQVVAVADTGAGGRMDAVRRLGPTRTVRVGVASGKYVHMFLLFRRRNGIPCYFRQVAAAGVSPWKSPSYRAGNSTRTPAPPKKPQARDRYSLRTAAGRQAHVLLTIEQYEVMSVAAGNIVDLLGMQGAAEVEFDPPRATFSRRPADLL